MQVLIAPSSHIFFPRLMIVQIAIVQIVGAAKRRPQACQHNYSNAAVTHHALERGMIKIRAGLLQSWMQSPAALGGRERRATGLGKQLERIAVPDRDVMQSWPQRGGAG